jgi:hypothetical protein
MAPHRALLIVEDQRAFAPPPRFIARLTRSSRRLPGRIFTRYIVCEQFPARR